MPGPELVSPPTKPVNFDSYDDIFLKVQKALKKSEYSAVLSEIKDILGKIEPAEFSAEAKCQIQGQSVTDTVENILIELLNSDLINPDLALTVYDYSTKSSSNSSTVPSSHC